MEHMDVGASRMKATELGRLKEAQGSPKGPQPKALRAPTPVHPLEVNASKEVGTAIIFPSHAAWTV